MTAKTVEISKMIDMLPDSEQNLVYEFIKRVLLAWDPDFTKVTPQERKALDEADAEIARGDVFSHDDIDWD